jgi:hypothetical protein
MLANYVVRFAAAKVLDCVWAWLGFWDDAVSGSTCARTLAGRMLRHRIVKSQRSVDQSN